MLSTQNESSSDTPLKVDLHSHTTASDGRLSPAALIARAREQQVEMLAITDHDSTLGCRWLLEQNLVLGLDLIVGAEFSCLWGRREIHVVGLNLDLDSPVLKAAEARQHEARTRRAQTIADRLQKRGMPGALEGAIAEAQAAQFRADPAFVLPPEQLQLGRPHFADWMVAAGHVPDRAQAFKKYLGAGKPGAVKSEWPHISEVVDWVRGSGGVAVLAHPVHYKMTNMKLRALLRDFVAVGGAGLEIACPALPQGKFGYLAELCQQYELAASSASDFHGPYNQWLELGRLPRLPEAVRPVWQLWSA